ncbi:MAG: dCTP deaminase [Fusobacterium sp.]|nr:dCTP deaminase [Fusobacterium sp.]
MLVYDQILKRVENYEDLGYEKPMIEKFNKDNLQSVSYDVTIGNKIRRFKNEMETISLASKNDIDDLYEEVNIEYGYKMRPGEFILARLNEKVNMPNDIAGHIRPRTTFNKLGIIITSQHINPSYSGNLQIGIRNCTPNVVILKNDLKIGQIVFEKVDGEIREDMLYKNKKDAKYHNEDEFVGSKVYNETKIQNYLGEIFGL